MLAATDLVWREGMPDWVSSGALLELPMNGVGVGPPKISPHAAQAPQLAETSFEPAPIVRPAENADIFISYSQKDRAAANWLAAFLAKRGYGVWWDTKLIGGQEFREAIMRQLEVAKTVLVLWSANSIQSRFVIDEADRAAAGGKVVSVLLDGFEARNLPVGFGTFQSVRISDEAKLIEALINRGLKGDNSDQPFTTAPSAGTQSKASLAEEAAWQFASKSNNDKLMREFLRQYPESPFAASIRAQIQQEKAAWDFARNSGKIELLEEFQRQYPNSEHVVEAKWQVIKASGDSATMKKYYADYPESVPAVQYRHELEAQARKDERADQVRKIYADSARLAEDKIKSRQGAAAIIVWVFAAITILTLVDWAPEDRSILGSVLGGLFVASFVVSGLAAIGLFGRKETLQAKISRETWEARGHLGKEAERDVKL